MPARQPVPVFAPLLVCLCLSRYFTDSKLVDIAGDTVTVEMHQQPNDRSCANEAIGGNHYGPVIVRRHPHPTSIVLNNCFTGLHGCCR